MIATSLSLTIHEPCLVDSVYHYLQVSSIPLVPIIPSPISMEFTYLWQEQTNGDLQPAISLHLIFGYNSSQDLIPTASGGSLLMMTGLTTYLWIYQNTTRNHLFFLPVIFGSTICPRQSILRFLITQALQVTDSFSFHKLQIRPVIDWQLA